MSEESADTREILAYVAGLFDGEGCVNFTVSGQSRTVVLRVMLRNTDAEIIDYLQGLFGGRIEVEVRDHVDEGRSHWKPSFCWREDGARAIAFLCAVEPWVRIKREQIFCAKMYDAVRNRLKDARQVNQEYRDMIDLLVRQMQWLNRKGKRKQDDKELISEMLKTIPEVETIMEEVAGKCR